jgi:hypothetical protein
MPLGKYVDYDAIAVVFQAQDYAHWLPHRQIKAYLSSNTARRLAPITRDVDPQVRLDLGMQLRCRDLGLGAGK